MNNLRGLAREGGATSGARMRQALRDKFDQLEDQYGRTEAIMRVWRAGKRSGYDAAYRRPDRKPVKWRSRSSIPERGTTIGGQAILRGDTTTIVDAAGAAGDRGTTGIDAP